MRYKLEEREGVIPGKFLQSASTEVDTFFSKIFSYFCFFVAAFRPCHGKEPRKKYINTYPIDSKSSRRDCSNETGGGSLVTQHQNSFKALPMPMCVFIDAYLAVPVKFFPSL